MDDRLHHASLGSFGTLAPLFGQVATQLSGVRGEEVEACVAEQRRAGGRLGEILFRRGLCTRDRVAQVLQVQARQTVAAVQARQPRSPFPYPAFLSLCMPAYNEAANIEDTLRAACAILPEVVEQFEVVVVDDGSGDSTGDLVGHFGRRDPRVRLVCHPQNRGYGAAVSTGLRAARGELVMFTDSDGQFSLLDLPRFLARLPGHDAVVGYRAQRADAWHRLLNAWGWNQLIRLFLGPRVRDLDCAFKLFRRELLDRLHLTATGAAINAEIMAQCARGRARIAELPVRHFPRYHGAPTGAALRVIARAFRELPRMWKYRTGPAPRLSLSANGLRHEPRLRVCALAACPFPANHGTPGSIREMSEAVAALGHNVHIVTYHFGEAIPVKGPQLHRVPALTSESAVVVGPTWRRPLYDLLMVFKTLQVIHRHRPHLLHAHGYEAALAAGLCRAVTGLPVVYSGHNTMGDELASYRFIRPQWLAQGLARLLDAFVPRLADRCVPHSSNLEEFFRRAGLQARTEPVVPFGIDVNEMADAANHDGAAGRLRYGLGRGPVVLYTGVLDQFQRLDLLLEAMSHLLLYEPAVRLLIVVTIAQERHLANLRRQITELGLDRHVVLTEPQCLDGVRELLPVADVAVVPRPRAPGFPIKLLNYMAARRPCVLFASSASQGLSHGDNAFLATPDTGLALGEALLTVLRDEPLRRRLAESGHQFVRAHHDRLVIARKVCDAYRRSLGLVTYPRLHGDTLSSRPVQPPVPSLVRTWPGGHLDTQSSREVARAFA
jgi:glycosyltransferase involved in cell wall biosynthesis